MKNILQKTLMLGLLLLSSNFLFAQQKQIEIKGTIIDSLTKEAIPYATVMIMEIKPDKKVSGTTSREDGAFDLTTKADDFFIEVRFMGYKTKIISKISENSEDINLGNIFLTPYNQALDEVVVTGERSKMEFRLDKRVFNVGSDISSTGMGVLDVLNNVPSVNVNIQGEISLRGNRGVQILIDGKPSVLANEQSNALGTITANMIESIEVITNPSAKYEAQGTSGIINIILKKEDKQGFNGSISANTGIPDNHSIGVSLNRRTENFNLFTQMGAGHRSLPFHKKSANENLEESSEVRTEGTEYRNETFFNITLGTDYYLNDKNVITLSGNFAYETEKHPSNTKISFFDSAEQLTSKYERIESTSAKNPKYQYNLQYKKKFENNEEHILQFSTLGAFFGKDQSSDFINTPVIDTKIDLHQFTETDFYQNDFMFKLDYTNPISEKITLESGGIYEINDVGNEYAVYNRQDDDLIPVTDLTNTLEYSQKVLGLYGTGALETENWGLKIGFRWENTDLQTLLVDTQQENLQNYSNLFPSLHSSYKFNDKYSVQAGYSKRIFRPGLWDLNPFLNVRNNYNISRGNPNLEPEFSDSYELTGIFIFGKASLNTSIYHLFTTKVIENIATFQNNVTITSPVNIGSNKKTGLEINGKYTPFSGLNLSGNFNYGYFNRQANFQGQEFNFQGDQYSFRLTSKFKLPADIDLEISGDYQSDYPTIQGKVSGFVFVDVGLRKKLWDGKAIASLSVRDIFSTRIEETFVRQENNSFYNFSKLGTFFTFGVSYSFGDGEAMTYSGGRR